MLLKLFLSLEKVLGDKKYKCCGSDPDGAANFTLSWVSALLFRRFSSSTEDTKQEGTKALLESTEHREQFARMEVEEIRVEFRR